VFDKSLLVDFRANFLPCKEVRTRYNGLMQVSADAAGGKFTGKTPEWIYQTLPNLIWIDQLAITALYVRAKEQ